MEPVVTGGLSPQLSNGGSVSSKLTFPAGFGFVRTAAASTDSGACAEQCARRPQVVSQRVEAVAASFHPRAR